MDTETIWTKIADIRSPDGQDVIYAAWSTGEIFQLTKGDPPPNSAGYKNFDTVLKLKNILPNQVVLSEEEASPTGLRL